MIQWAYRKLMPPGRVNNIFVVAFTTAYVHLKMYDYLESLQDHVLYTDSLIYTVKEGESALNKLSRVDGGWNSRGELVYKGKTVEGSHMISLLNLSFPYKKKTQSEPRGWVS